MIKEVEIKILEKDITIPKYATLNSAGIDLCAYTKTVVDIPPLRTALIRTGISINMQTVPEDMMAIILPRSGKGAKEGKVLGNLVGVIDQDYQGELLVSLWNRNPDLYVKIEPMEKFAQLVFVPIIIPRFKVVEKFSCNTGRGDGGFGSTDGSN